MTSAPDAPGTDPNSFANIDQFKATHMDMDLGIDFAKKSVVGNVTVTFIAGPKVDRVEDYPVIVLDVSAINVTGVFAGAGIEGKRLSWAISEPHQAGLGSALVVALNKDLVAEAKKGTQAREPDSDGRVRGRVWVTTDPRSNPSPAENAGGAKITIMYHTKPTAGAMQWLPAAATASGKMPLLFTQCQAILARSCVPCQDAPEAKVSYTMALTVPTPMLGLASALSMGKPKSVKKAPHGISGPGVPGSTGWTRYEYRMSLPIPTYLIAFIVGELEGRKVGPRSTIYAEPAKVEKCAREFEETEKFVAKAEEIAGPYVWGEYNVVVVPKLPYGGMENPVCTFVTPTIVAGDKSQVDVIIHEISHSWTGNLVSCGSWPDFWLNEGFTMFLQRKIESALYGPHAMHLSALVGQKDLADDMKLFATTEWGSLVPPIRGIDPDDAFSTIPYERGFLLLVHLEKIAGGHRAFMPFFRSWIQDNAFKGVTTEMFQKAFADAFGQEKSDSVGWNAWLYNPKLPEDRPEFDRTEMKEVQKLANTWMAVSADGAAPPSGKIPKNWRTVHKVLFLDALLSAPKPISKAALKALDSTQGWGKDTGNSEVKFRWQRLRLAAGDTGVFDEVVDFVSNCGRMKFTRPLFRELAATGDAGKKVAKATFAKLAGSYHPITSKMVAKDLGVEFKA